MKYEADKRKEQLDIHNKYLSYSKKGGTIYKRKSTLEEIAINSDKLSKKAVQNMSDNLIKLLLQSLK